MPGRDVQPLSSVRPVRLSNDRLYVIDQTELPWRLVELELTSAQDAADAIKTLKVRGAPLIGIVAAYAIAVEALRGESPPRLKAAVDLLASTRPTARDLFAALERMTAVLDARAPDPAAALLAEARAIHAEDLAASERIASHADTVLPRGGWALTICNTGALATGGGGTALALLVEGYRRGLLDGIFVLETRPLLQGARLTCWELERLGVQFELLIDSAAAPLLAAGRVSVVATGADRIARNGDFANKVGTRMLALLTRDAGVPFYVVAPRSTFDCGTPSGAEIVIEQRCAEEVHVCGTAQLVPESYPVYNPSFDVTESGLVTSFVTDSGAIAPAGLEEAGLCS